jgi:hypothetical protein
MLTSFVRSFRPMSHRHKQKTPRVHHRSLRGLPPLVVVVRPVVSPYELVHAEMVSSAGAGAGNAMKTPQSMEC